MVRKTAAASQPVMATTDTAQPTSSDSAIDLPPQGYHYTLKRWLARYWMMVYRMNQGGRWDARTGCCRFAAQCQRAANIMTLIQSAKLNGLDPYAYLSDVLKRLPTHKVTQIEELLPHCWKPKSN
ncbi:Putative transposase (identified by ISEscan HMM) [Acinetobacter baumannii]|nr:Putative transposase (identified by ISEscan HMM) [Acinetobacter baumannii]